MLQLLCGVLNGFILKKTHKKALNTFQIVAIVVVVIFHNDHNIPKELRMAYRIRPLLLSS